MTGPREHPSDRRSRVMLMLQCSSAVAAAAPAHNTDGLVDDAITSDRAKGCARI